MADPTMRDVLGELATLRGTVEQQGARLARYERRDRRGHTTRRLLPVMLAALLVALIPLATLAANPFTDLTGGPHDGNIDAIYNAGITAGCVPNAEYCPTANVTREEMASFLAGTAGLGGNPPIVSAATAQSAVNAQTATSAQNAATLGGQPPSAYLPASGDTVLRYPGSAAFGYAGGTVAPTPYGGASITLPPGGTAAVAIPLPRTTAQYGRFLAITSLRVCYQASFDGIAITRTILYAIERGTAAAVTLANNAAPGTATTLTCYDVAVAPRAIAGANVVVLFLSNNVGATRTLTLDSLALTLPPLAAGTAEMPGDDGGNLPQP